MAVYVDDMYKHPIGRFGRMKMSHMMADTREELDAMADRIGVARKWIQHEGRGRHREHYDISMGKRELAIRYGAVKVVYGEGLRKLIEHLKAGMTNYVPDPADAEDP